MKKLTQFFVASMLPMSLLATGCPDDSDEDETGADGTTTVDPGTTTVGDSTTGDMMDTGGTTPMEEGTDTMVDPPEECNADAPCMLPGSIEEDMELAAGSVYVMPDPVTVDGGATLTIGAGATIRGLDGSYLLIEKGAQLDVQGTAENPVVMTANDPATAAPGAWGGLVLLGEATTNAGENGIGQAEGFPGTPPTYGGTDDAYNCGTLLYLRVEYAGFAITDGNELNGITFYSCGTDTTVNWVQSHMGADDGIEMFGGIFDAQHVVITGATDDSLDCDLGYRGTITDLFIHQRPDDGDNAFEWSNGPDFTAEPVSEIEVVQATIVGNGNGQGATFKEGVGATVTKSIFANFGTLFVLENQETQDKLVADGEINDNFFPADYTLTVDGTDWDADAFDAWLGEDNSTDDPELGSAEWENPDIVPAGDVTAADGGYRGAIDPDGDDWTVGWTNYVE